MSAWERAYSQGKSLLKYNLNYKSLFLSDLPDVEVKTRMANALARSRRILEPILQWTKQDLLEDRLDDLRELVTPNLRR